MSEPGAGDIIVSGGGTTMVATDVLVAQMGLMRRIEADAAGWQARIGRIRSLETNRAPSWIPGDSGMSLLNAAMSIEGIEVASRDLADKLGAAADAYGQAERYTIGFERIAGEVGGWLVGLHLRVFGPVEMLAAARLATLAGTAFVGVVSVVSFVTGASPQEAARNLSEAVRLDPRILTDPTFVAALRVVVSSLDDVGVGFLGLPPAVSHSLGDDGLGVLGVTGLAAGTLALGRPAGLLEATPVTIAQQGAARAVLPPTGLADAASRIPPARGHRPQVRIEEYGDAEHRTWAVYIAGTVDWNPEAEAEPWDLSSNVAAMASERAGSYAAVQQAMTSAGIAPEDPVAMFGHSQGGLVAEQVAASGAFNTVVVATFGAPEAPVPIADGVTHVTVEHTDDLVPALGGLPAAAAASAGHVLVRTEAFRGRDVPLSSPLPAHDMTAYLATAERIDGSPDPRLIAARATLADMLGSAPGTVTDWRGRRVTVTAAQ